MLYGEGFCDVKPSLRDEHLEKEDRRDASSFVHFGQYYSNHSTLLSFIIEIQYVEWLGRSGRLLDQKMMVS